MADEGFESFDLTGRWVGFYRYRSAQAGAYPITAELHQEGRRVRGEMYDQITSRENTLERAVELFSEDISPEHKRRVEAVVAQFGEGAVTVNSRLPETSDIDGRVAGNAVRFAKVYRGDHTTTWTVNGNETRTLTRERHTVHYAGRLDRERKCIVGQWLIRIPGWIGWVLPPTASGTFELYRKS